MQTSRVHAWTNRRSAFTLVEVLVVLVIISISFAVVVFSVTAQPFDHTLQREAERMAGWIRAVTLEAAERNEPWNIRYNLETDTVEASPKGKAEGRTEPAVHHRLEAAVQIEQVVRAFDDAAATEQALVDVSASAGGSCEPHLVILVQQGVGKRTLEVNPVTGDVVVLKGRRHYERIDFAALVASRRE